jgi:hypothetical protein
MAKSRSGFTAEFKAEAVRRVTEEGRSQAAGEVRDGPWR